MEPLLLPILDVFEETFGRQQMDSLINLNKIEFAPLAFMRGRTFKNSVVLLDESQNISPTQLRLFLTRIGENSKMIVTGDTNQSDLKEKNGLMDFLDRFSSIEGIAVTKFDNSDITRHHLIEEILKIYDEPILD